MEARMPTPEEAREELERRRALASNPMPTPEEARAELARRKSLADADQNASTPQSRMNYITGDKRTPIDTLRDLASGAASGLAKGGEFINRQMMKIPGATQLASGIHNALNLPNVSDEDVNNLIGSIASPNRSLGGDIAQGLGSYAPYGAAGGAGLLGQALAGAAHGAATSAPEETHAFGFAPSGPLGGALTESLINAVTHGGAKFLESLRPSKMFRGQLSPQELQKNLDITQGTETGLGDVIKSPFLKKRLENSLTVLPFSGANESLQRTGKEVVNRGQDLLTEMLGNNDASNVPAKINDILGEQFLAREKEKTGLYNDFNKLADQEDKLKLDLPRFSDLAKKYAGAIKSTNMLQFEPEANALLNRLTRYSEPYPVDKTIGTSARSEHEPYHPFLEPETNKDVYGSGPVINPQLPTENNFSSNSNVGSQRGNFAPLGNNALPVIKYPSAQEALLLKGTLNRLSNQAKVSPDPTQRGLSKVFGSLSSSLGKDIRESVANTKNEKLINALTDAEENYKKNFSGFLDRDIYKFVSGNADPETIINKFIKTSSTQDLAGQLTKLATKIPPQQRSLLAYSYLSRALDNEGNLNPAKLSTDMSKLGPNQLKVLFPDKSLRDRLMDYSKLAHMNTAAQYLMFNPKNGQTARDALVTMLLGMTGHALSGDIGSLAAATVPVMAGRAMTKALTSPTLRENLVKAMIANQNKFSSPGKIMGSQALSQALLNQLSQGNQ